MYMEIQNKEYWDNELKGLDFEKTQKKILNGQIEGIERLKSLCLVNYYNYFYLGNKNSEFLFEDLYSKGEVHYCNFDIISKLFNSKEGHNFKVSSKVLELLDKTEIDCTYNNLNIPFSPMFIDLKNFKIEDTEVIGVVLFNSYRDIRGLSLLVFLKNKKTFFTHWYNILDNGSYLSSTEEKTKNYFILRDKVCSLILNILMMLCHPEVEIVERNMSMMRERKHKKGLLGVPNDCEIRLTGKLKKYIYEDLPQQIENNKLTTTFWVRGHFIHFNNDRYINMKGKMKWVLPFIKGIGTPVNKNYKIGDEEEWYHQERMISLIRNIYPDKEPKIRDRITLDGLEMDCYLPELKLGFEYNGEQHYNYVERFHKTIEDFKKQQERDIEKNKRAEEKGIKLITIRYDETLSEDLIKEKINQVKLT